MCTYYVSNCNLQYYIRMFICMCNYVCLCCQVVLWSTLFKCHLELGHYEEAYEAMMANPDPIRSV